MTKTSCSGLAIGFLVEIPVVMWDVAKLGLVPSEVGLDPSDPSDFYAVET